MLVKTHINPELSLAFVTLLDGKKVLKQTTYQFVHDFSIVNGVPAIEVANIQQFFKEIDHDVAILRKLSGAKVDVHGFDCDRTHTNFAGACNRNLNLDVIEAKKKIAAYRSGQK